MLEQLRKNSRSFIIWILFGIIIAVFIISFGPQADQQIGCGKSKAFVLKVHGGGVGVHSWRFGNNALPLSGISKQARAEMVMDLLLQRELLAQAAEKAGFKFTNNLIAKKIANGEFYVLGYPQDGTRVYYRDGVFDDEYLDRVIRNLGLPNTKYFLQEQRRELLAATMKSLLAGGVQVSRDELLARFRHERTRVSIDYVKFRQANYMRGLQLTKADVDKYLAENDKDVKKKYEDDKPRYKDRGKEVRVSHIFVRKSPPKPKPMKILNKDDKKGDAKTDGAKKGDAKKDDKTEDKKVVEERDPKQDVIDKLRVQLVSGKDFAEVAKASSEDKSTAWKGGDMGWRPVGSLGWGKELSEAAKELEKGKISEVIKTPRGFHILRIDDTREGTLSYDQVKHEIAERLARDHYAKKAAKADAEAALAMVKAGKKLEELFERRARRPGGLPGGLTPEQLKNLPPELLQKLLQGQRSGSLSIEEGPKVLAEWSSLDQQPAAGGGAMAKPPAKPAVKKAAPKKAAPKKAAGKKGDAAKKDDKPKPVFPFPKDGIPRPPDIKAPGLEKSGPFSRLPEQVPGVGKSKDAVKMLFEDAEKGAVLDKVIEVPDGYAVIQLIDREDPNMANFSKQEPNLRRVYLDEKMRQTVQKWVAARCREAVEKRKVSFARSYLEFQDDDGKPLPIRYQPCTTLTR